MSETARDPNPPLPPVPDDRTDEALEAARKALRARGIGVNIDEVRAAIDAYNKAMTG